MTTSSRDAVEPVFEPRGKVAVVTGAAGGIGLGMARAFTDAGMSVVLADLDGERIAAAAESLRADGHDALGVATDVSSIDDVRALAEAAMDTHGRVDVLCNNAGVGIAAKLGDVSMDDWEWTLGIDLLGPIHGVHVFQPLIEQTSEGGHLNSTSSVAGLIAGAGFGPYNVAKHGVVALMATLERELRIARSPHRASVLCPGPINTDIGRNSVRNRRGAGGEVRPTETGRKLDDKLGSFLSRGMDPDEVGRLVLDAIIYGRFWILTHPKLLRILRDQVDVMEPDGALSPGRLF